MSFGVTISRRVWVGAGITTVASDELIGDLVGRIWPVLIPICFHL